MKGLNLMSKLKDLTGQKFGRLTVIERAENAQWGGTRWKCHCDCGNLCVIQAGNLSSGSTKSCGCIKSENAAKLKFSHGMQGTKIYRKWLGMKNRCLNPRVKAFVNYGGRGITIYPAWINDFQAFYDYVSQLEHFGEEGYTLDRIDNNGNYEPDNLRWADAKTQRINQRHTIKVEYNNEIIPLIESAKESGINYGTLKSRYKVGDRGERLFRPAMNRHQ